MTNITPLNTPGYRVATEPVGLVMAVREWRWGSVGTGLGIGRPRKAPKRSCGRSRGPFERRERPSMAFSPAFGVGVWPLR